MTTKIKVAVVFFVLISFSASVFVVLEYKVFRVFDEAVLDIKMGNFGRAQPKLEVLAMLGYSRAQRLLGDMYAYGWGSPRNRYEAIKWYRRIGDEAEGLKDPAARIAYYIGMDYAKGTVVGQDQDEAKFWLEFAKQGGYCPIPCPDDHISNSVRID